MNPRGNIKVNLIEVAELQKSLLNESNTGQLMTCDKAKPIYVYISENLLEIEAVLKAN